MIIKANSSVSVTATETFQERQDMEGEDSDTDDLVSQDKWIACAFILNKHGLGKRKGH